MHEYSAFSLSGAAQLTCKCVCVCVCIGDEWDFCVCLYSSEGIFEKHELWIPCRVQITAVMKAAEQLDGLHILRICFLLCAHASIKDADVVIAQHWQGLRGKWCWMREHYLSIVGRCLQETRDIYRQRWCSFFRSYSQACTKKALTFPLLHIFRG